MNPVQANIGGKPRQSQLRVAAPDGPPPYQLQLAPEAVLKGQGNQTGLPQLTNEELLRQLLQRFMGVHLSGPGHPPKVPPQRWGRRNST